MSSQWLQLGQYPSVEALSYAESFSRPADVWLEKPIVIPQYTNIFHVKSFSPFARVYSPALAELESPISQEEFLSFIDGLNHSFLASPIFQATNLIGGIMMGTQILPAQLAGGGLQAVSIIASAGVSFVRVRNFLKATNEKIFNPRGLIVKVIGTKKLLSVIGFVNTDSKGKLKLPPLDELEGIDAAPPLPNSHPGTTSSGETTLAAEDAASRRVRALDGHIAPLTFDVPAVNATTTGLRGKMSNLGGAPLRWANNRQTKNMALARSKSAAHKAEKAPEVVAEWERSQRTLEDLDMQIAATRARSKVANEGDSAVLRYQIDFELGRLESARWAEEERRDLAIANIYKSGNKKLEKAAKKEQKIANRILWIVITKVGTDECNVGELLDVETHDA